jgi:hypothetical protein
MEEIEKELTTVITKSEPETASTKASLSSTNEPTIVLTPNALSFSAFSADRRNVVTSKEDASGCCKSRERMVPPR